MASVYRVRTAIAGGSGAAQLGTMYFEDAGTLTAQDAADAVHDFWDDLKSVINSGYSFRVEDTVYRIDVDSGQPTAIVGVSTATVTGVPTGDPLPWGTQGVIRWNTGEFMGGRQILGHTYVPGMLESVNVGGVPDSVILGALNTAAANLLANTLVNFDIYSRKNRFAANVISGSAWTKWSMLRSRRD